MINKRLTTPRGFTLTELIIATAIIVIVILAIGMVLVDGQRGWSIQYDRTYSDVVIDGYVARKKFDAVTCGVCVLFEVKWDHSSSM